MVLHVDDLNIDGQLFGAVDMWINNNWIMFDTSTVDHQNLNHKNPHSSDFVNPHVDDLNVDGQLL